MRIDKIHLFNWCQHQDRTLELSPGMNGIFGPNGSGKSNSIDGAVYAITGKSRTDGILAENVRHGTKKGQGAGVAVTIEHSGHVFEIERRLQGSPSKVLRYNGEEFVKSEAISEKLQEILGVSDDILLKYVFVEQWKIFEFLSFTESVRAKFLSYLFGTEKTEKIWDKLRKTVDSLTSGKEAFTGSLPQLQNDLGVDAEELASVCSRLAEFPETEDSAELDSTIMLWQKKQQDEQQLFKLQATAVELETRMTAVLSKLESADKSRASLAESVKDPKEAAPGIREELNRLAGVKSNNEARAKLEEGLKGYAAELTAHESSRLACADMINVDSKQAELQDLLTRQQRAIQLSMLSVGECRHCGSLVPVEKVLGHKEEAAQLANQIQQARKELGAAEEHNSELRKWQQHARDLRSRVSTCQCQLDKLPPMEPYSEQDVADLRAILEQLRLDEAKLYQLDLTAASLKKELASLLVDKGVVQEQKDILVSAIHENSVTFEKWQAASEKRAKLNEQRSAVNALIVQKAVLEAKVNDLKQTIRLLEEAQAKNEKAEQVAGFLERVRDVFHKTRLARRVAEAGLAEMEDGINDLLDRFDSTFRIEVQPNLGFKAKFNDGRVVRAERLSGGQKAVFALAFRMVVNSKYAKDLGLLVLDEPTAGVDEANLSCLETALDRLRQLSKSSGLQVILITHEKLISNLFDKSHHLPALR